jgi:hypothetical protein
MLRWRQVAMIVTLSLTLSATAHAECAWVLWWAKGSGEAGSHLDWEPQSAHLNKEPAPGTCRPLLSSLRTRRIWYSAASPTPWTRVGRRASSGGSGGADGALGDRDGGADGAGARPESVSGVAMAAQAWPRADRGGRVLPDLAQRSDHVVRDGAHAAAPMRTTLNRAEPCGGIGAQGARCAPHPRDELGERVVVRNQRGSGAGFALLA